MQNQTKESRQKLVEKSIHESHLEGHDVSEAMLSLYDKYIEGTMTIEEVIDARLKSAKKIA